MATKRKNSQTKITPPPPVYLARVEVENIRCFGPRQTLHLLDTSGEPAHWTIILGPNSGGKTTLLQSIVGVSLTKYDMYGEMMTATRASEILSQEFMRKFWRGHAEKPGEISATHWRKPINASGHRPIPETCCSSISIGPSMFSSGREVVDWASLYYAYGATRRVGRLGLGDESKEIDDVATLFDLDALLNNAEDTLLRLDYAERRNAETNRHLKAGVFEMLANLLPLVEDIRIFDSSDSPSIAEVQFDTEFGQVKFAQLGHGYQTMIGWVVDLASRMFTAYPNSTNPFKEAAVVLIDEIDLHMHPDWQRKIMGYLSGHFPNVQFIATAHSPLIVQGADENTNIAVLRREGDHVVIDNKPENVRNWRVDQILASDLFSVEGSRSADTDDLLAERRKILTKPKLTKKDRARVEEIEEQVGYLPGEETAEDRAAWEIVRRAADRLKKQDTAAE